MQCDRCQGKQVIREIFEGRLTWVRCTDCDPMFIPIEPRVWGPGEWDKIEEI